MSEYQRSFCEKCQLIFSKKNHSPICSSCKSPLKVKSFNPNPRIIFGLLIIVLGLLTLSIPEVEFIWIGGFIWGVIIIYRASAQWNEVKKLDPDEYPAQEELETSVGNNQEVFNCGNCGKSIIVEKKKDLQTLNCPSCSKNYKIFS